MFNKRIENIILNNWKDAKINYIKEFSEGYNNVAYDVNFINNDKEYNYVIKIIKISTKNILKQKYFRKLIKKHTNINIPKIIKYDFNKTIIDMPYVILEKVEGVSLDSVYENILNKEKIFEELGELYGKIHTIKLNKYGKLNSKLDVSFSYENWYEKKCKEINKIFSIINNNKNLSNEKIKINKEFFEKNKYLLKFETKPCLCHGDSAFSNIILKKINDKYHLSGIIDFEFCNGGGAIEDLFKSVNSFNRLFEYKKSLEKGHSKYMKLSKNWEKLAKFYHWMKVLEQISIIDKMSWRNLNKAQTEERRNKLKIRNLEKINNIIKNF